MCSIPAISITLPGVHEWKEVRTLRLHALKNEPQAFKNSFEEELLFTESYWKEKIINSSRYNPDEFFYIAKHVHELIGMAGVKKEGGVWKIHSVYVSSGYRGKGVGTALMMQILSRLEERGATEIELTVNSMQKSALHMYQKLGFTITYIQQKQISGDGKYYTKCIMRRSFVPLRKMREHLFIHSSFINII